MKLYSGPLSLFTAKVRIALDEKGRPYERIEVGWSPERRYEPHHPDVVALNPKRQVPVLVDGDVVVYDSTLILEYLEDAYPEPALLPRDAAERARCRQLEAEADEILFPFVWDLIEEVFYPAAGGERDAARAESAKQGIARHAGQLDKQLSGRAYLCDAFSVADIGNYVILNAALTLGAVVPDSHTNLRRWLERTGGRPAVQRETRAMTRFAAGVMAPPAS